MKVPEFTASASLYRSPFSYPGSLSHGSSNSVQAAAMAVYVNGQFYCYGDVTGSGVVCEGSGEPSGPRDQLCRPQCGPCRNHVKTCILRNCDDVERAC